MNEREIFQSAINLPDANERQAFLAKACGNDANLRERLEQLLRAHYELSGFLETPAAEQLAVPSLETEPTAFVPKSREANAEPSLEHESLEFLEPGTKPESLGRLAHYEVLEVLGRGAFGIVLKAFDDKLHRMVAIKVMNPELAATSPPRKRFLREAQSSARIRHENIVAIHAVEEQPLPYLVMEYIPGGTLQERLDQKGPLELTEILRVGQQIAAGLAAAHAQGLIHRDIKPANILIESGIEERVKITDFGLARATDDASLTQSGLIAGTPMYMSPEQARGQSLDHRTDLFSLGSVLYTMASGRPPFRAPNTIAVLKRVCEDVPRPISEVIPETPLWLCEIIAKLQAKEPDDRFQSAKDVADLLGQHLAHLQEPTRVPKPAAVVLSPSLQMVSRQETPRTMRARWSPATVLLAILVGMLTIPLIGGVLIFIALAIPAYQATQARNHGTLIVQSDEPSITAAIGDRRISLPERVNVEVRVPPGTHTVRFLKNHEQIGSQTLTVQKGQREVAHWPHQSLDTVPISNDWIPLFNGKDLTGWEPNPHWTIDNGVLVSHVSSAATSTPPMLVTQRKDFRDFHARVIAKLNEGGDSGLFFRFGEQGDRAVQVQITTAPSIAGGVLRGDQTVAPGTLSIQPDTWFTLEVIASGPRIISLINGKVALDWLDPSREIPSGPIAFESGFPGTELQIRTIEFKAPGSNPLLNGLVASTDAAPGPPMAMAPFDAAQAEAHQAAWAKYLQAPVEYTNELGMKFELIPPGEFLMGSTPDEINKLSRDLEQAGATEFDKFVAKFSGPQHKVRITRPFYLGTHEVTVGQYRRFIDTAKYLSTMEQLGVKRFFWTGSIAEPTPEQRAVIGISWEDAKAFCQWLSEQHQMTYALPSEAQWEYACRAGTTTLWSFGDDPSQLSHYAVFGRESFWPAEVVGTRRPNPFGLYDMHGNADEWCLDWHDSQFYGRSPVDDPVMLDNPGDKNSGRVSRGGTALSVPWWTRSTSRPWDFPATPNNPKGMRVMLSVETVQQQLKKSAAVKEEPSPPSDEPPVSAVSPTNAN
ncbi:MAG TPA: SUMF1/EgtB/PvdO family nonheme iron enzyme [Planctomycetaceae bacterium]|nr:SUMF1/EgtB/PvdO family nonheme iron enzyme [Planctomycetaceae bacterium]